MAEKGFGITKSLQYTLAMNFAVPCASIFMTVSYTHLDVYKRQIDKRALVQIEDAKMVLRVRIAAVDAITKDRHIGETGFRHDQELVHGARKAVDHGLGRIGLRIKEQDFRSYLVYRDHAA